MARYTVAHGYFSIRDGITFGPWTAGESVELDPPDAQWIQRDSPGALTATGKPTPTTPTTASATPADETVAEPGESQPPAAKPRRGRPSSAKGV